jgi:GDP-4-dehydro-6-deoxy-D-mannose reductase
VVRALVTGARGFVGAWLAEHLRDQGDELVLIDLEVDVTDPAAIGVVMADCAPEAVYHLAALTHVGASWDAPSEVLRVNVLGTAEVLAAARRLPEPPVTLVVSSAEVYGVVTPAQLPLTEDSDVAPVTPYAASKAAAEQVAFQAWRGFGQPVVVVRPFNHVGPGQGPNFAVSALARRIVEARRDGARTLSVGSLEPRRDFTDVRDVVRCYRLLVRQGRRGGLYNVCSGQDHSVGEIVARLLDLAGVDLELVTDPALLRPVEIPVLRGSQAALQAATGWKPEIPLEDTLRDVIAYWEVHPDRGG